MQLIEFHPELPRGKYNMSFRSRLNVYFMMENIHCRLWQKSVSKSFMYMFVLAGVAWSHTHSVEPKRNHNEVISAADKAKRALPLSNLTWIEWKRYDIHCSVLWSIAEVFKSGGPSSSFCTLGCSVLSDRGEISHVSHTTEKHMCVRVSVFLCLCVHRWPAVRHDKHFIERKSFWTLWNR